MRPTEVLMSEHRVIETVLDCLEHIAHEALDHGSLPREHAMRALEVLATFADQCHHEKEEHALFPLLERHGLPHRAGPLAVMLHEHELGRATVARMREALAADQRGDVAAPKHFATAANEYAALMRDHIAKEDEVLFPMAESMLGDGERSELLAAFERTEAHEVGAGTHERMLAMVQGLCVDLGIVASTRPDAAHGCCHGSSCHA